jgi:hypothetical protein
VTVGKADAVTLAGPQCKERFPLGQWRSAGGPSVATKLEPWEQVRPFGVAAKPIRLAGRDPIWGVFVVRGGVLCVLAGIGLTMNAVNGYPRPEPVIAELRSIRAVLFAILGGKMISWGTRYRKSAKLESELYP